ncbi:MAG: hypothetical protein A2086_08160 [Spirochaetes bacterium GWD1_27_9]|nr:MAG: hypothetical protein A2086_08160 [Spirochaetes bacterium GWD1_27_9]
MIKNVLITGGTGFIGSNLMTQLLKNDFNIILLKRSFSNTERINDILPKIKFYDIDKIDLLDIFKKEKIDLVINLATFYKKFDSYSDIETIFNANLIYGAKILELMGIFGIKNIINTGSFFEYSYSKSQVKENSDKTNPLNIYGVSKVLFENMLTFYSKKYNIKSVTLRLFYPYGERDNKNKLIPHIISNALADKEIRILNPNQIIDFIYIKDVVSAYIKTINNFSSLKSKNTAINIGSGKFFSVQEIIDTIEKLIGKKLNIIVEKNNNEDPKFSYSNINLAKKIISWQPEYSLSDGLKETIEYYKNQ